MFDLRIYHAILTAFVLATGGAALPVMADTMVFKDDIGKIQMTQAPCPIHIADMIREEFQPMLKGGLYTHHTGIRMALCWLVPPGQDIAVHIMFEDGDYTLIRLTELVRESTE